jgi:hypothetical protein
MRHAPRRHRGGSGAADQIYILIPEVVQRTVVSAGLIPIPIIVASPCPTFARSVRLGQVEDRIHQ